MMFTSIIMIITELIPVRCIMEKKKISTRELIKNLGYSTKLIVTVYPGFFACRLFGMLDGKYAEMFRAQAENYISQ